MNLSEYQRAKSGTLALRLEPRAKFKFTGQDRVRYLNGQTTNDVRSLRPGQAQHSCVCNTKARMDAEIHLAATADALWVDADATLSDSLGLRFEKYIIADDVLLENVSASWNLYHVIGAEPAAAAASMSFPSNRFGLPGYDLWIPGDNEAPTCASPETVELLRIRQGIPLWGRDMTPDHLPPEAGLEPDAISYSKGCYIGQEIIARLKSVGQVARRLVQLSGDGALPATLPMPCFADGVEVGQATSAALDPETGRLFVLAMIKRNHSQPGCSLTVGGCNLQVLDRSQK